MRISRRNPVDRGATQGIPEDASGGICPNCLLQLGLGSEAPTQPEPPGSPGSPGSAPAPPAPTELADHFPRLEILELLGQGGMGVVYKARQPRLDRLVALKILPANAARDPAFAERFQREARALARLSHPGIVAVFDFGQAGPYFYFRMEYVDGVNLRQMAQSKQLTPAEALTIVPKICEALQYVHDEGIVHRDIKKANILIDEWHKGQAQKRGGGRTVLSLDEQTAEEIRHLFAVLAAP